MANSTSDRSQNPQGRESQVKDTQQSNQGSNQSSKTSGNKTNVRPGEQGNQESHTKGGDASRSGSNR